MNFEMQLWEFLLGKTDVVSLVSDPTFNFPVKEPEL